MTTDNFCFYLRNRLFQTSQTGYQQYSDTSPFSIPWLNITDTLSQCYIIFCNNLRIFEISKCVCPWQAYPALQNKYSSQVQKFVNYRQKSFLKFGPWSQSYKTFCHKLSAYILLWFWLRLHRFWHIYTEISFITLANGVNIILANGGRLE